jgi:hypothetical protein
MMRPSDNLPFNAENAERKGENAETTNEVSASSKLTCSFSATSALRG